MKKLSGFFCVKVKFSDFELLLDDLRFRTWLSNTFKSFIGRLRTFFTTDCLLCSSSLLVLPVLNLDELMLILVLIKLLSLTLNLLEYRFDFFSAE